MEALVHWHRYVLVRDAIGRGLSQSARADGTETAFEAVARELEGTSFAGTEKAMEYSYGLVRKAITRGDSHLFFRFQTIAFYRQMLDPEGDIYIKA